MNGIFSLSSEGPLAPKYTGKCILASVPVHRKQPLLFAGQFHAGPKIIIKKEVTYF